MAVPVISSASSTNSVMTISGSNFATKTTPAPHRFRSWDNVVSNAAAASQFDATGFVNYASPSTNFICELAEGIGGSNCLRMNLNMAGGVGEIFPHHEFGLPGVDYFRMSYWAKAERLTANASGPYAQLKGARAGVSGGDPVADYSSNFRLMNSYISGASNNLDAVGIESIPVLDGVQGTVDYGTGNTSPALFNGQWHFIEFEMQMNTVGQSNGICRVWMDGSLILESTNRQIRNSSGQHFDFVQHNPGWANDLALNNWRARETRHYVDTTSASVFRGNAGTLSACTGKFLLPPTSWAAGAITASNDANIPSGYDWLYVTNATGETNTTGFLVQAVPPVIGTDAMTHRAARLIARPLARKIGR